MSNKIRVPMDLKVGEILYTSWGYNMTHIDYYKVVRTTAKTAFVKQLSNVDTPDEGSNGFYGETVPGDTFESIYASEDGEVPTYQVQAHRYLEDNGLDLDKTSYSSSVGDYRVHALHVWDGKPKRYNSLD